MSEDHDERTIGRRDVLRTAAATGVASMGLASGAAGSSPDASDVTAHGMRETVPETGDRTVRIEPRGPVRYEFTVTGLLAASDAPRPTVDGGTAAGKTADEGHEFTFSGEFTDFELDGDADVVVDGEPFDVSAFPRRRLEIDPSGPTEFDVSASGAVQVRGASVDRPTTRRATGRIDDRVTVAYEGELTYLTVDGEATLRRDGDRLSDPAAALPSTRPHVARVETSRGSTEYELEVTDDAAVVESRGPDTASDGTVSGRAVGRATEIRYAGRATAFRRDDGAAMTVDERAKRIACRAPADAEATFTLRATDGIVRDGELVREPSVTVPAGETELVKYVGQVTGGAIGTLALRLDLSAYPEASDSARLQHAAEAERHPAFDTLATAASRHGRVRHDVGALSGLDVDPSEGTGHTLTTFAVTDLDRGDDAEIHLVVNDDGSVREARNEYRWTSRGTVERLELDRLGATAGVAAAGADTLETEAYDYDLPTRGRAGTASVDDSVSTDGILGDIWQGITGFVGDIAGMTEDLLKDAINTVIDSVTSISAEDIVVKSSAIVCSSFSAIENLYDEFLERAAKSGTDKWAKAIIKTKANFFIGSGILLDSDFVQQAQNGDYGCAGCIFSISFLFEFICSEVSKKVGCAAISWPSAGLGGVGCVIVLEAVCGFATILLPDAKSICSDTTTPTELDLC